MTRIRLPAPTGPQPGLAGIARTDGRIYGRTP